MYICLCKAITDKQIEQVVKGGADTMRDLNKQFGICSQCGKCAQAA